MALIFGYIAWDTRGCAVKIVNSSQHRLENVELVVLRERYPVGTVQQSRTKRVRVFPKGEGSIELIYVVEGSTTPLKCVAGYVETGYKATFTIDPEGNAKQKTEVGIALFR